MLVVAAFSNDATDAWVSLHEKQSDGSWQMIMTTPGFIGKNGLGKTKEGDAKTPTGVYHFNRAFGISDDPGCAIPYVKADKDTYWSGDPRKGYHYNELVNIKDLPDLDTNESEHITDYIYHYQYCLNISYNEEGVPGRGSAIFLHCLGLAKPFTGGCVAIPEDRMKYVIYKYVIFCLLNSIVGLQLSVLSFFSEAVPANSVDTPFYIFTVVSLPSGASVRKDVWVQVPPSA